MNRELFEDKLEYVDDGEGGLKDKLKSVAQQRSGSVLNRRTNRPKSMSVVRTPSVDLEGSIEFKEESNVLQVGDPNKNKARRLLRNKDKAMNRSKTQGAKKRSKSILKNQNKNRNEEEKNIKLQGPRFAKESIGEKIKRDSMARAAERNSSDKKDARDVLPGYDSTVPPLDDQKLNEMLTLTKEELFDLDSISLK